MNYLGSLGRLCMLCLTYILLFRSILTLSIVRNNLRLFMTSVAPEKPLAVIARILEVNPIKDAANVESVKILGWDCVSKKEEFKVGDLCIYFVIGTIFPTEYERTKFLKDKPLKTKKILGTISQGMVAPLFWLHDFGVDTEQLSEGDDVTSFFNARKYVEPEETAVYQMSRLPSKPDYVPRTDEERIQNIPEILKELAARDCEVIITRKEDGCSATYSLKDEDFHVCGRNCIQTDPTGVYVKAEAKYGIEKAMRALGRNLAIQGEIVGPRIGGNRLKLSAISYRVFNIFDLDAREYLPHDEIEALTSEMGLETVPLLFIGSVSTAPMLESVGSLMNFANAIEYVPGAPAEGVVVKVNERANRRLSFKAIANNYLLKFGL